MIKRRRGRPAGRSNNPKRKVNTVIFQEDYATLLEEKLIQERSVSNLITRIIHQWCEWRRGGDKQNV